MRDPGDHRAAELAGVLDILHKRLDPLVFGHLPAFVLVPIQELIEADGGAPVLLHPAVPLLEERIGHVWIATYHLVANYLDARYIKVGCLGYTVFERLLAQEVILLKTIQAHGSL